MNARLVIPLVCALLAGGCVSQRAALSPFGAPVVLRPLQGQPTSGELLAVGPDSVWIGPHRGTDRVRAVALAELQAVRVNRYGAGSPAFTRGLIFGAVSGLVMSAACSSVTDGCGAVFLFSLASSALLGFLSDAAGDGAAALIVKPPDAEQLRPYARFPQGLPPGFR